jgi:hypothetical protein
MRTWLDAYNHADKRVASQMVYIRAQSWWTIVMWLVHSLFSRHLATVGLTLSDLLVGNVYSWQLNGESMFWSFCSRCRIHWTEMHTQTQWCLRVRAWQHRLRWCLSVRMITDRSRCPNHGTGSVFDKPAISSNGTVQRWYCRSKIYDRIFTIVLESGWP